MSDNVKLSEAQIDAVVNWMNTWGQLKGTAIPIRFKEDFSKLIGPTYANEEYLDLHGSKDNAYLKPRITSNEYFHLPEDKRRFYMRF